MVPTVRPDTGEVGMQLLHISSPHALDELIRIKNQYEEGQDGASGGQCQ